MARAYRDTRSALKYIFEWDPAKDLSNRAKHGVSFRHATLVFRDPLALSIYDEEHSVEEERWATAGLTGGGRVFIVHHTFQQAEGQATIRIFSARQATRRERQQYEEGS